MTVQWPEARSKDLLEQMFNAAVAAANPEECIVPYLPARPAGRTIVVGAGKAGAPMARAVEKHMQGDISGIVIVPYGHKSACEKIEIVEAAHPVPDEAGYTAARQIFEMVSDAGADDLVICLISGGGSSLLTLPATGIMPHEKAELIRQLLLSGADISEMNCVRRHLSDIKGGRLAIAAYPAKVVTYLISDVPGDDPSVIASGPTVPDNSSPKDAAAILKRYKITEPVPVINFLRKNLLPSVSPTDPRLQGNEIRMVATPQTALEAAALVANEAGVHPIILGNAIEGEAREVAKVMAAIAWQVRRNGQPSPAPTVLLSGGETTVTVTGKGRGGRNSEFMLALAIALQGEEGVYALAADTDGIDGVESNAGAILTPDTLERARKKRADAKRHLSDNNSYHFFERLEDLFITGPTQTNVNDFRAILIVN